MNRSRIAILFGGRSEEHDVSVKSAVEIAAAIDTDRYEPVFVRIARTGAWSLCDAPRIGGSWEEGRPAILSPDSDTHGLVVTESDGPRAVRIDAVLPVLHGRYGEDGAVQGLLELAGIPYVGCDIAASAICMDKSLAYLVARSCGIETPDFFVLDSVDASPPPGIAFPVFVKPARSGSSFGVRRVDCADEWDAAVADARQYDDKVLVEGAVAGVEVGCAVLGDGRDLTLGEVDQITLHHGIFRIHQEAAPEQGSENAVITVPAELPDQTRDRVRETAAKIYRTLGCRGLARVDMFLRDDGGIVLNEVNTFPGFTSYSRYPRMMAAAGIGLPELIDRSIALALGR